MAQEPSKARILALRVCVYGGAAAGWALVVAALVTDDEPLWWWLVGVPLAVLCGFLAAVWLSFQMRHRTPESRQRAIDALVSAQDAAGQPAARSRIAHRATKHKKDVLGSGVHATAVIQFVADGHRANTFHQLVYLELEVTQPGGQPYLVKTGEYVNAASAGSIAPGRTLHVKVDPQRPDRVAVDWERSLRLS